MADKKISQLTSATALTGAELVPVVQAGATVKTTVTDLGGAVGYTPAGTGAVVTTVQSKLRESVSVKDFGAVGDGVTDDTAAIQAAITYCLSSKSRNLFLPAGIYLISSTLNFGRLWVYGEGVQWQASSGTTATQIITNTTGILMVTSDTGKLSNFVINGNNKAAWGAMIGSVRGSCDTLTVVRCTEYGCVMNAAQNGSFVNLNCQMNEVGLVLANGTRNCNFYNFTSSIETGPALTGADAASRCLLFLIDTSNPRGFGLVTSVTTSGNDRINFYGGISESFNSISAYAVETKNNSAFAGVTAGNIMFWGYEFDANSILLTDSTFTGALHFYNPNWNWKDNSTAATSGTAGSVLFYGNMDFNGGNNLPLQGITQNTNYLQLLTTSTSGLSSATLNNQYFLAGGGSTVTFDAPSKTFSVSAASGYQGLGIFLKGSNVAAIASSLATTLPVIRATFSLSDIVGGGTALTGVTITGTAGQFSCAATTRVVGDTVKISGTFGGTGSIAGYVDSTVYYIIATNGTTTFTLSATKGGSPITTTAGTPTGLTYTPSGVMPVSFSLNSSPFRNQVSNYTTGIYQILYKCTGAESGGIEFGLGSCTSAKISGIKIEVL